MSHAASTARMPKPHTGLHYAMLCNGHLKSSGNAAASNPLGTLIIDDLVTCATIEIAARVQYEVKPQTASATHRGALLEVGPRAKQVKGT